MALDGFVRRNSLYLDTDALYFTDDGTHLQKVSLVSGKILWRSDRLVPREARLQRAGNDFLVERMGKGIIVSTPWSVCAVDRANGLTLWAAAASGSPHFVRRFLTDAYVVAIDVPLPPGRTESVAYFYDQGNGDSVSPEDGGELRLGLLSDIRSIVVADDSLWIQDGETLRVWSK